MQYVRKPSFMLPNLLVIISLSLFSCSGSQTSETLPDQPNIIFFALDDLNDWINPLGYHQAITPNLDRLAASGVMFTNADRKSVV